MVHPELSTHLTADVHTDKSELAIGTARVIQMPRIIAAVMIGYSGSPPHSDTLSH